MVNTKRKFGGYGYVTFSVVVLLLATSLLQFILLVEGSSLREQFAKGTGVGGGVVEEEAAPNLNPVFMYGQHRSGIGGAASPPEVASGAAGNAASAAQTQQLLALLNQLMAAAPAAPAAAAPSPPPEYG